MLKRLSAIVTEYPKSIIAIIVAATIFFAFQLPQLRWETDARVYLPKGHSAILYDEKVAEIFGATDAVIIGIVNDERGIFNPDTLARIARITEKVAALPGVVANRTIDVASLSTATAFVGNETSIGTEVVMPKVPTTEVEAARIKDMVYSHKDLFVGNIVSADGKAAMIRARLKEGQSHRYQTYWQIQGILAAEKGGGGAWPAGGGAWQDKWKQGGSAQKEAAQGQWPQGGAQKQTSPQQSASAENKPADLKGDKFYLAGRPVIEVTSGMSAMQDMMVMIPLLILALAVTLFVIFRTGRGVFLPLFVMLAAIVWTMGSMVLFDVPLYTISTMLPVILVAVGIGDAVHLMSHYYDEAFENPQQSGKDIVTTVMGRLGAPLVTTTVTTMAGFLSLIFAEMPPFVIFGIFTVLGVAVSWLLTIILIPAMLTLMKPKVGSYLAKRRAVRVHSEQSRLTRYLVDLANYLYRVRRGAVIVLLAVMCVAAWGASKLYVDSSWMSDFRKDSELVASTDMLNERFDGTIFLNIVIEGSQKDAFKSPALLKKVEELQAFAETLPKVGSARSVVDYIKSMNRTFHAGDDTYNVIPDTETQIGEYLFLFSVSGRPQQLDEVIDFDYQRALVTIAIKTDHTQALLHVINEIKQHAAQSFSGQPVTVNYAGSANNSYIWADLLIGSQTLSIVLSKVGIFLIAALIFRSLWIGLFIIIPVSLTTLIIAGVAGFAGIPLDVSTALAAGVAIGVGVDYAVHFIFSYRDAFKRTGDQQRAAQETMRRVGRTILFNGIVVTVGFAVLFWSQFPPHVKLGYFVAAYMVLSCIMALIVLPLLLYFYRPFAAAAAEKSVHA